MRTPPIDSPTSATSERIENSTGRAATSGDSGRCSARASLSVMGPPSDLPPERIGYRDRQAGQGNESGQSRNDCCGLESWRHQPQNCLLYTSDAADDLL